MKSESTKDFESFTRTYVEALQTGSVLSYEKAYEKVSKRHNNKLVATLVHEFETELKKMDTPVKRKTDIERKTFEILNKKLKQLRNESYPYKNNIHEVLAMEKMKAIADKFRDQNSLLVQHNLQKTLKTLYDDLIEQNEVLIDSKEGAMFYNLMISDRMKSLFHSKMQPYDEDERLKAILNFEESIADEKIRIIYNANLHEERQRNELLEIEIQKSVKQNCDRQSRQLRFEQKAHRKEKDAEYERNYRERAGEEPKTRGAFKLFLCCIGAK